jgi:hypothetical protein
VLVPVLVAALAVAVVSVLVAVFVIKQRRSSTKGDYAPHPASRNMTATFDNPLVSAKGEERSVKAKGEEGKATRQLFDSSTSSRGPASLGVGSKTSNKALDSFGGSKAEVVQGNGAVIAAHQGGTGTPRTGSEPHKEAHLESKKSR